jgi:predicted ATPase
VVAIAGERAVHRAATLEGTAHFRTAIDLLLAQPQNAERDKQELRLLTLLGPAPMLTKGWAAPDVGAAYERARELASQLAVSADLVPSLVGTWLYEASRGQFDTADKVTERLFEVAEATGDDGLLLQAHHAAWPIPIFRGEFAKSEEHIKRSIVLYDRERHRQHAFLYFGHDPAVCAHSLGGQAVWALGFPERARRHVEQAFDIARSLEHAPSLAVALWFTGASHAASGDPGAALSAAEELLQLSEDQKLLQTVPGALIIGGWAIAHVRDREEGLERMRTGLERWSGSGARSWLQPLKCLLAEHLVRANRLSEAFGELDEAISLAEQRGSVGGSPERIICVASPYEPWAMTIRRSQRCGALSRWQGNSVPGPRSSVPRRGYAAFGLNKEGIVMLSPCSLRSMRGSRRVTVHRPWQTPSPYSQSSRETVRSAIGPDVVKFACWMAAASRTSLSEAVDDRERRQPGVLEQIEALELHAQAKRVAQVNGTADANHRLPAVILHEPLTVAREPDVVIEGTGFGKDLPPFANRAQDDAVDLQAADLRADGDVQHCSAEIEDVYIMRLAKIDVRPFHGQRRSKRQ